MLKKGIITILSLFILLLFTQIVSAASIDFNLSNLTSEGILRAAFDPYYAIFGNLFWGIVLGMVGAGLYANERSIGTVTTYLILVGVFCGVLFPNQLVFLFGLILAFLLSTIFYITFIESRS